jgi:hypothetical protein
MGTIIRREARELVGPGRFIVTLSEIGEREVGQHGPIRRWTFTGTRPDGRPFTLSRLVSDVYTSDKCTSIQFIQALLGRPLPIGAELDLDELLGCQAEALVTVKVGSDGEPHDRIDMLLPLGGAVVAPAPPNPPASRTDGQVFGGDPQAALDAAAADDAADAAVPF